MIPATTALSGVRIWLSGSIPTDASPEESSRLTDFSRQLAQAVFREGATLVHGFHPSLTPTLLEAAREFKAETDLRAPLSLLVSTYFRESYSTSVGEMQQVSDLQEIPRAPERAPSIALLREALASQADALIAIGGKWWKQDRSHAGVPAEFNLAIARGIPAFLLGGLGGATAGYLEEHPEILRNLRNGLDKPSNQALAAEKEIAKLVSTLLEQIGRLPIGRRETASGQRFRVLCLDGGGIRGAFTAATLAAWEQLSNSRVADHFDLIAGTSTGGILAIGLGLGLRALEIVEFYRKRGPVIFPITSLLKTIKYALKRVAVSKYDASVLETELRLAYNRPDRPAFLADSPQRLLITSYNLTTNALSLYRTSHHPNGPGHDYLEAAVVARATSAAPTYFDVAKVEQALAPHEAVDGGVWANCPALAALGEAVGVLNFPLDRLDILSVGTAGLPTLIDDPALQGMAGWGQKAPDLLMNAQMDCTLLYMKQLLGERFVRIDDTLPRVESLDSIESLPYLIGRGELIGQESAKLVMARFLNGIPAQPWREL